MHTGRTGQEYSADYTPGQHHSYLLLLSPLFIAVAIVMLYAMLCYAMLLLRMTQTDY